MAGNAVHIVAVAALVAHRDGRVLLMKHPRRGWEFPGGQVEPGEDLIAALRREVREETGIEIGGEWLAAVCSNVKPEGEIPTKVMLDFTAIATGGALTTSAESLKTGWFDRDAILAMIAEPFIRDRARTMLAGGGIVYRAYSKNPYVVRRECRL